MALGKRKLAFFKKRLEEERSKSLKLLRGDAVIRELREGDKVPSDEADQAASLTNQTLSYSMRRRELLKIREIDEAIKRIDDGTYGTCEETGEAIEERRLEVQPWTRVSLEAAKELELARKQNAAARGVELEMHETF